MIGCTRHKLMTGEDAPLKMDELYSWGAYLVKKSELEAEAYEKAKKGG